MVSFFEKLSRDNQAKIENKRPEIVKELRSIYGYSSLTIYQLIALDELKIIDFFNSTGLGICDQVKEAIKYYES